MIIEFSLCKVFYDFLAVDMCARQTDNTPMVMLWHDHWGKGGDHRVGSIIRNGLIHPSNNVI